MPELPDITVYIECLQTRIVGRRLERVRLGNPFVLRSVRPSVDDVASRPVLGLRRLGKRIAIELEGARFAVLHLMIAGRLHWKSPGAKLSGRHALAAFDFDNGSLLLTEAGSKKRASLHLVEGEENLALHDPGGLEVLQAELPEFAGRLTRRNHTLKRALTDPGLFSGIGNAYSDEILHRAGLSPLKWTSRLDADEIAGLYRSIRDVMGEWIERLRLQAGDGFPEKVTAFREEMAVHGRFQKPCPRCGSPVQRIVYSGNEANYCPICQTGGKLLADRALSRLLGKDWPRSLEELERRLRD